MMPSVEQKKACENGSMSKMEGIERVPSHYEFDPKAENVRGSGKKVISSAGVWSFLTDTDKQWMVYMTVVAIAVRLAFLYHPSVVVFDEVHFGGFAAKYLRGEFFSDLHPPLARLLVTLSAWIGGFDGKFNFYTIGADYLGPAVPYVTMRAFTAMCGVAVIPVAFVTMRAINVRRDTATAFTLALIFENALTTQSRLILLDSYLIIATTLVALFWVLLQRHRDRPFSWEWYGSLFGLGVSLALAASCKWVGLFAVVGVGLFTIIDLWNLFGDVRIPLATVGKHIAVRSVALIFVPLLIYASTFYVHFKLLRNFSSAAASYSLEFQQTLAGGELEPVPADLYYGATVRIRQYINAGPFLHSHDHLYPAGSKQQQITGYHHRDINNLWTIRFPFRVNHTYTANHTDEMTELKQLKHYGLLRLEHAQTGRFLHSHEVAPPVSHKDRQNEVSGYGHNPTNFSDLNDNWIIEIVDDDGNSITDVDPDTGKPMAERVDTPPIFALNTKFRLMHQNSRCWLHSRHKKLPQWGYEQIEITCGKETLKKNQIWIIEKNTHPLVNEETAKKTTLPKKGFWGRFVELNRMMWSINEGLDASHPFGSRPNSWPWLSRGIGFWNGNHVPKTEKELEDIKSGKMLKKKNEGEGSSGEVVKDEAEEERLAQEEKERADREQAYTKFKGQQIYLIGNPMVWWASTVTIGIYIVLVVVGRLSKRRNLSIAKYIDLGAVTEMGSQSEILSCAGFMFIQWLWHFVPFFGMKRQLFLHHYLPALYFSVLLMAIVVDGIMSSVATVLHMNGNRREQMVRMVILGVYVMAVMYVFWRFAPLGYGLRMSKSQCQALKWLPKWDFDCNSLTDGVSKSIVTK